MTIRAWLCRRGEDLPFALTVEQLGELGYGNISMPPFEKVAPLVIQQKPLTDEEMRRCSYDAEGFMVDREIAMRNVERAHGIGEEK